MRRFQDGTGREWMLSITLGSLKRVRDLLNLNLAESVTPKGQKPLAVRLLEDPVLLCDVVFALIQPQASERGVSDQAFGEALTGKAVAAMQVAMFDELADFFRESGQTAAAEMTQGAVRIAREVMERVTEFVRERIETGQTKRQAWLDTTLSNSVSTWPDSLASPPSTSPSANST